MSVKGHRTASGDTHRRAGPTWVAPGGLGGQGTCLQPPVRTWSPGGCRHRGPQPQAHVPVHPAVPPTPVPGSWGAWDALGAWSAFQGRSSRSQHVPRGRGRWWVPPSLAAGCLLWGWAGVPRAARPHPHRGFGGLSIPHAPRGKLGLWDAWVSSPPAYGTPTVTLWWDVGKSRRLRAALGDSGHPKKPSCPSMEGDTLPRAGLAGSHGAKTPAQHAAAWHTATAVPCPGHGGPRPPVPGGATHPL